MGTNKSRAQRINDEPAWVLHAYDWSESSLILDVLTRNCGRVALVAKGAKRPHSQLRPVLLPLQPLRLSFAGDTEVKSLRTAEWQGADLMPQGEILLAGLYVNELLMRLLPREDPHPGLFDGYEQTIRILTKSTEIPISVVLRGFELVLLRSMGYLPQLNCYTLTQQTLEAPCYFDGECGTYCCIERGKIIARTSMALVGASTE